MRAALLALAVLLAASCGPATPAGTGDAAGATFLLANPGGLTLLDERCAPVGKLAALPDTATPSYPALDPSRSYVIFGMTLVSRTTGFGSDLYAVNLDGSDLRPIVEHESENVFYASPRFDPSGTLLYFHRRAAIIRDGVYVGNEDAIERLDLRTGERRRLIDGAADPDISRDGRTLAYVRITDGQPDASGPWLADVDGSNARRLLARDSFVYLQAPRFSPTNDDLIFSAAGHTVASGASGRAKLAHLGIPSDLYLTSTTSPALRSVAVTGDDVVPAWSPDGSRVAYVGTGALFLLTPTTQSVVTCAEGQDFFYGDLLWLR